MAVIHAENFEQALRNVLVAKKCGCDGCFLINHTGSDYLVHWYNQIVQEVDWWIGLNDLRFRNTEVLLHTPESVNGIWIDNLGMNENEEEQVDAKVIWEQKSKFDSLLFGGVAFKYQRKVHDVAKAAKIGMNYCDVVTTSGEETGRPPNISKIKSMKVAIGDKPLAVASGIDVENVRSYIEYVDYFLVATGMSKTFTELDPAKVEKLVKLIHS